MLTFAIKYGKNITSQYGENGIISECLTRLKRTSGVAVEFGAPTKEYCSNIFPLSISGMWLCHYFDIDPSDPGVTKKEITTSNINELPECDVLSMDTDGPDWELWRVYDGKPDIVIIEINSSLPPMVPHFTRETGASYSTMLQLGIEKGYFLVCHTGNMAFVRNEHRALFPEMIGDGIDNWKEYFNTNWQA